MNGRTRGGSVARLLLAGIVGVAVGTAGYTFVYAKGAAYMTNDPAACANCHVMQPYLDGWMKSSHHAVAVCNDCHAPSGFFAKYATKASNGWHHSVAFTSGEFHEPIEARKVRRRRTSSTPSRASTATMPRRWNCASRGPGSSKASAR